MTHFQIQSSTIPSRRKHIDEVATSRPIKYALLQAHIILIMPAGNFSGGGRGGGQKGGSSRSGGQKGGVRRSGQAPRNREGGDKGLDRKAAEKIVDEVYRVDKPKVQAMKAKKEAQQERAAERNLEKRVERAMFANEKEKQQYRNASRKSKADEL